MNRPPQLWLATFLGAGLSPLAPGTAGSLAASLVLFLIYGAAREWPYLAWQEVLVLG